MHRGSLAGTKEETGKVVASAGELPPAFFRVRRSLKKSLPSAKWWLFRLHRSPETALVAALHGRLQPVKRYPGVESIEGSDIGGAWHGISLSGACTASCEGAMCRPSRRMIDISTEQLPVPTLHNERLVSFYAGSVVRTKESLRWERMKGVDSTG
jgi:hypothetical protein